MARDEQPSFAPMTEEDLGQVCELEKKCFKTPWSRELFLQELARPETCRWITAKFADSRVAGYMGWWKVGEEAHVTNLAVAPDRRCKGLGKALVAEVLRRAKKEACTRVTLEVRPSNRAAVKLYESFGFKAAALRPAYYSDNGEDALLMWKTDLEES